MTRSKTQICKKKAILLNKVKKNDEKAIKSEIKECGEEMGKYLKKSFFINQESGRANQSISCLKCEKIFAKISNATDHVRTHFQSKPFAC